MTLTPLQIRQIKDGIADCERFIAKESSRIPALRPKDMQEHLDFCIAHRVKLYAMLQANSQKKEGE